MSLEQLFGPRRRVGVLATVIALTMVTTWSSVSRLRQLVDADDSAEDFSEQSLVSLAERNVLEHLPQRAGHAGSAGTQAGLGGTQELVQGAPDAAAAAAAAAAKAAQEQRKAGDAAKQQDGVGNAAAAAAVEHWQPPELTTIKASVGECQVQRNTDFWGDALVWGANNRLDSAGDCCQACADYKPTATHEMMDCNVWVYCEDAQLCGGHHRECWLKHLAHPEAAKPAKQGPDVGWTTGLMDEPPLEDTSAGQAETGADRKFHTIITAQGPAVHWQSRVAYYWFKKIKAQCEAQGNCQMGGFTRLLHSGQPDDLMDEIPTVVVNPLPPEHPNHGYVVLNRPYAFLQWVNSVTVPEKYVLMSEPDHVWLKPMPNLMRGERPAAFPFFYIEPWKKEFLPITAKFLGPITRVEAEKIAPIGNAPTLMSMDDMKRVMPVWFNMSIAIHNDPDASKEWGWVQEMYAFTLSCTKVGIKKIDLHLNMMAQPPYDTELAPYYLLHYTYGMDYSLQGEFMPGKFGEWRFDKRSYHALPPPRNLEEPPVGMKNELVRHLIHAINEATEKIPGWDDYEKTGHATKLWNGVL